MRRVLAYAALLLAVPAAAQERREPPTLRPSANPGALIAVELAFSRLATERGQWTAFAETAAEGAEMFVPQRVVAHDWLKGRANPAKAVTWQADAVFSSCDGSYAVTRGAWQGGKAGGWFSTVWQRQPQRKGGGYKWVLDQGGDRTQPAAAPEFISGKVADCPPRPPGAGPFVRPKDRNAPPPRLPLAGPLPALSAPAGADSKDGQSDDGTLAWRTTVLPDGARDYTVWLWQDGAMAQVLHESVPAGG